MLILSAAQFGAASVVERGPWSGALTPTSAVVKAKLILSAAPVRLAVAMNPDLSHPFYGQAEKSDSRIATFRVHNLVPNHYYYYALESSGVTDLQSRGRFRTYPLGSTSFAFAFASCARTASSHPVFETILRNNPLFFMNIGDFHYLDIKQNDRDRFRAAYDLVLSSRTQSELYRQVPFLYMWDDHDFGVNANDAHVDVHKAARLTYQEYLPHYPLAAGSGDVPIHHAFTVG